MKPTDFDHSKQKSGVGENSRQRAEDLFNEFDPREYGALEVSRGRRNLRAYDGLDPERRFVRRRLQIIACALATVATAMLSIYFNEFVREKLMADQTVSKWVSSSAAQRRRIAIIDPADQGMEDDDTPNRI